jgi:mono/diheme cytochrome c family protein
MVRMRVELLPVWLLLLLGAEGADAAPSATPPPRAGTPPVAAKANGDSAVPTKRPPDVDVGRTLWGRSCASCHGDTGRGDGPAASAVVGGVPPLPSAPRDLAPWTRLVQDGRGRMPGFAETLDVHDTRRVLVYLRERQAGRAGGKADAPESPGSSDGEAP